jgi:hypothetical protein
MKKAWIALAAVALLALPAAAGARDHKGGDVEKNAARYCKSLYVQMGPDAFRQAYGGGHNAFGKCVSSRVHALLAARRAALATCKQELSIGQTKLRHEGGTDPQTGNGNGNHGALKKCVRDKIQNLTGDDKQGVVAAIKTCLAERGQDPAAFAQKYDPSGDGHEALGHCVRAHLPQSGDGTEPTTPGGTATPPREPGRK